MNNDNKWANAYNRAVKLALRVDAAAENLLKLQAYCDELFDAFNATPLCIDEHDQKFIFGIKEHMGYSDIFDCIEAVLLDVKWSLGFVMMERLNDVERYNKGIKALKADFEPIDTAQLLKPPAATDVEVFDLYNGLEDVIDTILCVKLEKRGKRDE